jgi:hypothetical protein
MASRRIVSFPDRRDTQDRWFAHPHPAGRKSDPRLACADPLSPPHPTLDTNTENFHVQAQERALIFGQSSCTAGFAYLRISSCSCWFGELG